jgi:hypothetical protein
VTRLWNASAPLTAAGLLMLALVPVTIAGMLLDPRVITGMPAWLKPVKFAISLGIASLTIAWLLTYVPERRRLRAIVGWVTAVVFVVEMAIISAQAWRGTTSHFNVGTPLDEMLFAIMGIAILTQTLMVVALAVALCRTRFDDRAMGWAIRLGVTLSIVGASTGGLMTRPTEAQMVEFRAGHRIVFSGAHTVGAPDGGPGVPGTGWSVEHGDLRVPHFVGLHAVQALPIVALLLGHRRVDPARRVRLVFVAAASHASLFAILLWQALRAQSVVAPDTSTLLALGVWAAATVAAAGVAARSVGPSGPPRYAQTA